MALSKIYSEISFLSAYSFIFVISWIPPLEAFLLFEIYMSLFSISSASATKIAF